MMLAAGCDECKDEPRDFLTNLRWCGEDHPVHYMSWLSSVGVHVADSTSDIHMGAWLPPASPTPDCILKRCTASTRFGLTSHVATKLQQHCLAAAFFQCTTQNRRAPTHGKRGRGQPPTYAMPWPRLPATDSPSACTPT